MARGRPVDPKVTVSVRVLQSTVAYFQLKAKGAPPGRVMAEELDEIAHPTPRKITAAQCPHPVNRRIADLCMVCGAKA